MMWRVFLTVVVCGDVQNAASANQSGSSTNHIGRFEGLGVISQRYLVLQPPLTRIQVYGSGTLSRT